jgi:hypothetical protein
MIELERDALAFRFPEVGRGAVLRVSFQRTLRVPHDNRDYRLPDLGRLPLHPLHMRNGVTEWALPLYRGDAAWLRFTSSSEVAFAVKVECAGIDALTGEPARRGLHREPQDYVPVPAQTWLDGCRRTPRDVQQFTADGCVSHDCVCDMRITVHPAYARRVHGAVQGAYVASPVCYAGEAGSGPGPGMRLHGDVIPDPLRPADWDVARKLACCIRCVPASDWRRLTGGEAPPAPNPADYARAGVPWQEQYAES